MVVSRKAGANAENMNGPHSMYKMRPINKWSEAIELPQCMYKMKVIQDSCYGDEKANNTDTAWAAIISEQVNKFLKDPLPEVAALENRQESILIQLAELKKHLTALRNELHKKPIQNEVDAVKVLSPTSNVNLKERILEEIVIKANPKQPPYSLLAFNHLSQNSLNITNHVHSVASEIPGDLLSQFNKTAVNSPLLNIRLIWKDVSVTELLISPTKHTVICGEVNILRFLSRIGPPSLDYESADPLKATLADDLLDTCYKLTREKSVKARQTLMKTLSASVQKSQYMLGTSMSLVDIAAWSTLKQIGLTSKESMPNVLHKWFECCNKQLAST